MKRPPPMNSLYLSLFIVASMLVGSLGHAFEAPADRALRVAVAERAACAAHERREARARVVRVAPHP